MSALRSRIVGTGPGEDARIRRVAGRPFRGTGRGKRRTPPGTSPASLQAHGSEGLGQSERDGGQGQEGLAVGHADSGAEDRRQPDTRCDGFARVFGNRTLQLEEIGDEVCQRICLNPTRWLALPEVWDLPRGSKRTRRALTPGTSLSAKSLEASIPSKSASSFTKARHRCDEVSAVRSSESFAWTSGCETRFTDMA